MVHEPQKQEQEAKVSGKEDTDTSARMSSLIVRCCALMPTSPNDHRKCRHCQWNGLSPRSPHSQQEMVISLATPRLGAPFPLVGRATRRVTETASTSASHPPRITQNGLWCLR